ncbi:MAG: hypothetical protein IT430_06015 [Phycisphaerales bacterium]|nr:hypothetical protein [Phycisphaerales bacterium]
MSKAIDDSGEPAPAQASPPGAHSGAVLPPDAPPVLPTEQSAPQPMSGMETYNVVSDTIIGVNVRGRDNLIQFLAIVVAVILGVGVGALVSPRDRVSGAIFGGIAGLIGGLLLSGIALMIYRAIRHAQGRHD